MTSGDEIRVVAFRIGGQEFAFDVFQVERILRYEAPVRLPQTPDFLEGVLRYRGAPIPLVDLRKRLSVEAPVRDDTRVIVLDWEDGRVGVIVDAVTEVLQVPAVSVSPPQRYVRGLAAQYLAGIITLGERTLLLLRAGQVLTAAERLALQPLSSGA